MSWDIWLKTELDGHEVSVWGGRNYTHNCNRMIRDAGLPEWPYSVEGWRAGELYERLDEVIANLVANPKKYQAMDPPNGWGSYDTLIPAIREVRDQCQKYPSAIVGMSA